MYVIKSFSCCPFLLSSLISQEKEVHGDFGIDVPIYFIDPVTSAVQNCAKKL